MAESCDMISVGIKVYVDFLDYIIFFVIQTFGCCLLFKIYVVTQVYRLIIRFS